MKRASLLCRGLLSTLFLFALGCEPTGPDVDEIRQVWDNYDKANNTRNGELAASIFTDTTHAYYDRLVKQALDAPREQVLRLPLVDRSEILMMRNRATRVELEKLDGRGYVVFATSKGWYVSDPEETATLTLSGIRVTNDVASAQLVLDGTRSGNTVRFEKQGGAWKLDETSLFPFYSEVVAVAADDEGLSEDEWLIMAEEIEWGNTITDSIWEPLRKSRSIITPRDRPR